MKTLKEYYTRENLYRGAKVGLVTVLIFALLGANSVMGLAMIYIVVSLGAPAIMAKNDLEMEE